MHTHHHCLCKNNVSGLCYGRNTENYHDDIASGRIKDLSDWPNMVKYTYTDCPGYEAPDGTLPDNVPQGSEDVPPFSGI